MKQVIKIAADGTVTGLQMKKGRGLDLRKLGGPAEIKRVSEIVWEEDLQAWAIKLLQGEWKGSLISLQFLQDKGIGNIVADVIFEGARPYDYGYPAGVMAQPISWDDYDQAVNYEVAFIQWCITHGHADSVIDKKAPERVAPAPGER